MLLFTLLFAVCTAFSVYTVYEFPGVLIEKIFVAGVFEITGFIIILHFCLFLSMWLGKRVQWVLKKSDIAPIVYYDERIIKTLDCILEWPDVDDINYSETNTDAYLIINRYNIPKWARLLIFEVEVDDVEYIAEMPIKGRNI